MNRNLTGSMILLFGWGLSAIAQEPATLTPPASPSTPDVSGAGQDLRDPFWPPGQTPGRDIVQPPQNQKTNEVIAVDDPNPAAWPKPVIKVVTKTAGVVWVTVDGAGTFCTGESIPVRSGNRVYYWKIEGITKDGIQLKKDRVDVQTQAGKK